MGFELAQLLCLFISIIYWLNITAICHYFEPLPTRYKCNRNLQHAADLLLTGRLVTAEEALSMGLVARSQLKITARWRHLHIICHQLLDWEMMPWSWQDQSQQTYAPLLPFLCALWSPPSGIKTSTRSTFCCFAG